MREAGAVTIGQNESSSVIYGMPRVADEIGAVIETMDPAGMAEFLVRLGKQ
jgi:two-component system chemotaxis response regulator CheB